MSSYRVDRTRPIERWGQRTATPDNVGSAWSTSCARCSDKVSHHEVRRIHTGGGAYLNVCGSCKAAHSAKKAVSA